MTLTWPRCPLFYRTGLKYSRIQIINIHWICNCSVCQLKTNPAGKKQRTFRSEHLNSKYQIQRVCLYVLGVHQLVTLDVHVSFVSTTNSSTVDAPALICVVTLLGLEFAVALTDWVIDAIVVREGSLDGLSSNSWPSAQAFLSSVHLSLHQVALRDHWRWNRKENKAPQEQQHHNNPQKVNHQLCPLLTFSAVQPLCERVISLLQFTRAWRSVAGGPLHRGALRTCGDMDTIHFTWLDVAGLYSSSIKDVLW